MGWRVAYTRHRGRWDDPTTSITFDDLVRSDCDDQGGLHEPLTSAFLTTFSPWTLSFIKTHFANVDTTLFVQDECFPEHSCDECKRDLKVVGGQAFVCFKCRYHVLCRDCPFKDGYRDVGGDGDVSARGDGNGGGGGDGGSYGGGDGGDGGGSACGGGDVDGGGDGGGADDGVGSVCGGESRE
eukprot:GHVN01020943.1.p1 GENE.GHVN01020943.1~~GHVN01020943.1.p1  ORF type:complete len:183 (-),score=44.76 GHVN01020943.1:59-607(-)